MGPPTTQLLALGLTLALELPLAALLAPRGMRRGVLWVLLCANLATHPVANLIAGLDRGEWLAIEMAVVAFETLALRAGCALPWIRAAAIALAANALSAGVGLLLA